MTSATGTSMNLSGEWSGVYSYAGLRPPIHFSANLQDNGGWIAGVTEEIATLGEAMNRKISATLQGRRTGASVIWLKLYDRASAVYDAVRYEGEVSADGNEISGRWIVRDRTGPARS